MAVRRDRKLARKNGPQKIPGSGSTERVAITPQQARARRDAAVDLVKLGLAHETIVDQLVKRFGDTGLTEGSSEKLIAEARREVQARSHELQRDGRDLQIVRLHDTVAFARGARGKDGVLKPNFGAMLKAEQEIAKVLGTYTPIRHHVSGEISITEEKLQLLGVMSQAEIGEIIESARARELALTDGE